MFSEEIIHKNTCRAKTTETDAASLKNTETYLTNMTYNTYVNSL